MSTADLDNSRHNQPVTAFGVLELCTELTDGFTRGPVLMPIVVLQAERRTVSEPARSSRDPAATLVDDLYRAYMAGRVRCRRLPNKQDRRFRPSVPKSPLPRLDDTLGEYDDAFTLVRALSTRDDWDNARSSPYRPYSFPRSELLYSIEEAVGENADSAAGNTIAADKAGAARKGAASENTPGSESTAVGQSSTSRTRPDQRAVFNRLNSPRPRKPVIGALSALRSVMTVLMPVVGIVLSVELTTLSTPKWAPWALLGTGLFIIVSWLVLTWRQGLTAPLSGLYPGSHWLATSTFILADDERPALHFERLAVLLPRWSRRMRTVREERVRMIISQLSTAYYGSPSAEDAAPDQPAASAEEREGAIQQYLSLRVHALLEDLRANYRPWTLDLRRRKRKWPPMLFLPDVDMHPGHVRFVQAVSDLRSRRSETDPLLILASSKDPPIPYPGPEPDDSGGTPYKRWIRRLRVEQSPSLAERLPWVLLQKVLAAPGSLPRRGRDLPRVGWSVWLLWSRWTVAIVVALLCVGGLWRSQVMSGEYCGGWLFGHDPNLVLVNGECIGTDTTSTTAFLPAGQGVTLGGNTLASGATPAVGSTVGLSQVNLAYLEDLVEQQNSDATASGSYITFVYAGALTAPAGSTDPLGAMEELTGVLAWQHYINATEKDHIEIRIDIANDGDDSLQEQRMAQTVGAAADDDTSIAGVIGLGVDTSQSAAAIEDLADADLPILDTTNSDDSFPEHDWNYFGLSPTNAEEAQALVSRYASHGDGRYAVVLERVGTGDPYTQQQAQAAETALAHAGFKQPESNGVPVPVQYTTQTTFADSPGIEQTVCADRPLVIYLAGRYEDMSQVVGLLEQHRGCFPAHVTVLSGDDMAVTEFPGTTAPALAPGMTLYYVAQTDPGHVPAAHDADGVAAEDNGSGLNTDLQQALKLVTVPGYGNPVFANGLMALGFDAAAQLYSASTTGTGAAEQEQALPRAAVAPGLRCPLELVSNGATGPLGFADVHHGLDFFKAVNMTGGVPYPQDVTFKFYRPTVPGTCAPNVAS